MKRFFIVSSVLILGACQDEVVQKGLTEPEPVRAILSSEADLSSVVCPPGVAMVRRVQPGTSHDYNGNGAVCDLDEGTVGAALVIVTDDLMELAEPAVTN